VRTTSGYTRIGTTVIVWVISALGPVRGLAQTARTTANQGSSYGWQDPDGYGDFANHFSLAANDDQTLPAESRIYNIVGDPVAGASLPAYNGAYTLKFRLTASTPTLPPNNHSTVIAYLTTEYSINNGGSWLSVGGTWQVTASGSTPGVFTTVQTFTPTLTFTGGGPVRIRLILRGTASGTLSGGAVTVQAGTGYPVTWSDIAGKPLVDVIPYNFENQDYSRCALACFAAVYTQGTVPYYSLNAPRGVSLTYNGDRVAPKPIIGVSVSPDIAYGTIPTKYQFQVKVNGAFVTFVNGEQTLNFAYVGTSAARMGGQFDASSYSTGVYPLDILVTAIYPTTSFTTTVSTKLAVVNETTNPIARGWTIVGVQRLYNQTDGSALITDGSGSASYFQKTGSVLVAPAGDFSTLVTGTPSGGSGWTRRYPDSTKVVFDATGKMTEVRDRFLNISSVTYDGSGRVWQVTDPLNHAITLAYGTNGLSSITDFGSPGRVTNVTVDASKRLTSIQDPDNISTNFGYDASLRLSTVTDRRGFTTTLGYDVQSGKLNSITSPAIAVYQVGTVSPINTLDAWQKRGVPYVATSGTSFTAPLADTVKASLTEPGGGVTRFTVNRFGQPLLTVRPLGDSLLVRYNWGGQPTAIVRPGYGTTDADTILYNSNGLPTYTRLARLTAVNFRYAAYGQADSTWGTDRPGVRNFIGPNGRLDSVRVGGVMVQRIFYNTRGQVDSIKDGNNVRSVKNLWLGFNNNLSESDYPLGSSTYMYDSHGRPTVATEPGAATKTYYYDLINHTDSIRDGVNSLPIKVARDAMYDTSVTDQGTQGYRAVRNALGWITSRTDPAGGTEYTYYNIDGDVVHSVNRRGQAIDAVFDSLHRMTSRVGSLSMSWTYQNHGRVVTGSGGGVSTETQYLSIFGSPDSAKTVMAGQTYWRRYGYTPAGRLDTLDVSGGGLSFVGRRYLYDVSKGTLSTIRLNGTATTSLSLDNNFQVSGVTLPGLDNETHHYNTLHRTMQITSTPAGYNSWTQRDIGFDGADRVSEQDFGGAGNSGEQYGYDNLGRLASWSSGYWTVSQPSWCDPNTGFGGCRSQSQWVTNSSETYSYDAVGNRLDHGGSYSAGNRIQLFAGCGYTTDADGNVASRSQSSGCTKTLGNFTWLKEGFLGTVTTGGTTITLQYDATGRLVRKDVNGVPQSHFLWDGGNLLAELDGNGTVKRAEYSYYPAADHLHALIIGTTIYYSHSDAAGNVIALTDAGKNVQRTYSYDVWGTQTSANDHDFLPFNGYDRARWKGALLILPEMNLYYMRSRWYEAGTGRFLSEDPLGGLNRYVYAGNDPINRSDPSGLLVCQGKCGDIWSTYGVPGNDPDPHPEPEPDNARGGGLAWAIAMGMAALDAGRTGVIYDAQTGFIWDPVWRPVPGETFLVSREKGKFYQNKAWVGRVTLDDIPIHRMQIQPGRLLPAFQYTANISITVELISAVGADAVYFGTMEVLKTGELYDVRINATTMGTLGSFSATVTVLGDHIPEPTR
jgi:RHS repeat-associated protein